MTIPDYITRFVTPYGPPEELTSREKAIRAAAYIDTEGCISINKDYAIVCTFTNTRTEMLYWLAWEYGGSVHIKGRGNGRNKIPFMWVVKSEKAARFLAVIRPFLLQKTEQADAVLALRRLQNDQSVPNADKARVYGEFKQKIHALNRRGA